MRDLDASIDAALDAEERELLRNIGEEPGYFSQALGVFGGRTGWVNMILMVVQGAMFLAGVWPAWNFFQADDALTALRWGLPSTVALLMALINQDDGYDSAFIHGYSYERREAVGLQT